MLPEAPFPLAVEATQSSVPLAQDAPGKAIVCVEPTSRQLIHS